MGYPTLELRVGVLKLGWGGLYFDRPLSRREANKLKLDLISAFFLTNVVVVVYMLQNSL